MRFSIAPRESRFVHLAIAWLVLTMGDRMFGQEIRSRATAVNEASKKWGEWIEPDFPFFSTVLDARRAGSVSPTDNLTPRGIVLNLGHGIWSCFDVDLLRISAVWEGSGVTPESMATISYHASSEESKSGQTKLPKADRTLWLANGIYPGWQQGSGPSLVDPRDTTPTPHEVGRGPLAEDEGKFRSLRLTRGGVRLNYTVADARVEERVTAVVREDVRAIERRFLVSATRQPLILVLGRKPANVRVTFAELNTRAVEWMVDQSVWALRVAPHAEGLEFSVLIARGDRPGVAECRADTPDAMLPPPARWRRELITTATLSKEAEAYVVDDIALPIENPWRRNVRLTDIQFFRDGTAAGLTFDGDVWMIRGLSGSLDAVRWRRFASGLHEPLGMAIRDNELYVFDRNGIWRLRDTNNDGEADVHELFSNAFTQTAETREFPNGIKLAPDGSFVIAKGGQQSSTLGRMNGSVLRVSADGRSVTTLGWGFRQPFIGVHPHSGLVTASDQEGNYVPATPIYNVRGGTYHGFLSSLQPIEKYPAPIDEPLTWIPRAVSPSGVSQLWLTGARMGPLNDALVLLSYNRPELLLVCLNERSARLQASVVSLTQQLEFSPLGGAVNPIDGQLYVAGFRINSTTASRVSGLARVRYTSRPCVFPREIVPMTNGILVRFDTELASEKAGKLSNYSVDRWNYKRTSAYGSPHYKLDGTTGQERMSPSRIYLSSDHRAIFIAVPDMKAGVMQMQVGWQLSTHEGTAFEHLAYFTPFELVEFKPAAEGFESELIVDLTPKPIMPVGAVAPGVAEGRRVFQRAGCMACHSIEGSARFGPTWRGLFRSKRPLAGGASVIADEEYLRESIVEPNAKIVRGFEASMPSYLGVLREEEIESLLLFIKTLQ